MVLGSEGVGVVLGREGIGVVIASKGGCGIGY